MKITTAIILIALLFKAVASAADKTPPNILFISIDDMRPQTDAYGQEYMITPNLDRFASEGRLFKRHYVQVPTCGPSRACMLTGRNLRSQDEINHHHLGEVLAGTTESKQPESLPHYFKQNGYRTIGMGKISHSANGYRYNKALKKGGWELPHSWTEFVKIKSDTWKGSLLHGFISGTDRYKQDVPPFESAKVEDNAYPDGMLAELATAKLSELAKQDDPFFMAVGFLKPHLPFTAPKKYWDLYDRSSIPISPNPNLPKGVDPVFLHDSSEFKQYKKQPEQAAAGNRFSDDYARKIIHANFASVSFVDAQVGKVLNQLKATGLDQNTIVVIWGDHGWHLGDHTIWGKHSPFERALNSLLMVKTPGLKKRGKATSGLVASVDIYPTLCELAGLPKPAALDGKSFHQQIHDLEFSGRDFVMSYWRDIISVRTNKYRLALYRDNKIQRTMLFDHDKDPNETQNVSDDNPEIVDRLISIIRENHNGFLPQF